MSDLDLDTGMTEEQRALANEKNRAAAFEYLANLMAEEPELRFQRLADLVISIARRRPDLIVAAASNFEEKVKDRVADSVKRARDAIITEIRAGHTRRVDHIKMYRNAVGCSLLEAKNEVDRFYQEYSPKQPGTFSALARDIQQRRLEPSWMSSDEDELDVDDDRN